MSIKSNWSTSLSMDVCDDFHACPLTAIVFHRFQIISIESNWFPSMSIYLPLPPTDLCGCAAVVGWRSARSDLCIFLFCCAEGTMWDAEGLCRRYYVHSKTKDITLNQTQGILAAVARTRANCPQQSRCGPNERTVCPQQRFRRMDYSRDSLSGGSLYTPKTECTAAICVATTN